jgi:heterodisulfide reductase subunit C
MMAYDAAGNELILPSEKMVYLKRWTCGKDISHNALRAIREGIYLCTNCDRCTVVCPSGIRLKELWVRVREDLVQQKDPEPLVLSPLSFLRGLCRESDPADTYSEPIIIARKAVAGNFDALADKTGVLSLGGDRADRAVIDSTFFHCFGCQTCTTVCPVVGSFEDPQDHLGMLPHQLMCALGLGQWEMAAGARMIWDCVTCYQCQEHCPQNVQVTEVLYGLKNTAVRRVKKCP